MRVECISSVLRNAGGFALDDLFEHLMESERDKSINGFYTHFMIFLAVIAALAFVNLVSGDNFWIQWVVLGWGAGIALHAFLVFVRNPKREHELRTKRAARRPPAAETAAVETEDSDPTMPAAPSEEPGKMI